MITIPRHDLDVPEADKAAELLAARLPEWRRAVVADPLGPGLAMHRSLEEFLYQCAGDPRAAWSDTWSAIVRATQAGAGLFQAAGATEGTVAFRFDESIRERPATGPTRDSDAVNWLTAMWLAVICRERARVDLLANVPLDVLRASGQTHDEFVLAWVHTLQLFFRREDGVIDALLAAMNGTDPEAVRVFEVNSVLQVHYPPMELLYRLTQREDDKFNEALATALDLHKRYWTATHERARVPHGFVALAPLAIACLARDAGVAVEVESDYLPFHLLAATRVGEVST